MKKLLLLLCLLAGFSFIQAQEQNSDDAWFKAGFAAGYLSEIESFGGSVDLIYQLNDKWSIGNTNMFSVGSLTKSDRLSWLTLDFNLRYRVYDEFYTFVGGQYLFETKTEKEFNGLTGDDKIKEQYFGANIGAGYIYHLLSNANVFVELKYTLLADESVPVQSSGYMQARIGMVFDL